MQHCRLRPNTRPQDWAWLPTMQRRSMSGYQGAAALLTAACCQFFQAAHDSRQGGSQGSTGCRFIDCRCMHMWWPSSSCTQPTRLVSPPGIKREVANASDDAAAHNQCHRAHDVDGRHLLCDEDRLPSHSTAVSTQFSTEVKPLAVTERARASLAGKRSRVCALQTLAPRTSIGVNLFSVLYLQAMTQAAGKHMDKGSRLKLLSELTWGC